MLLRVDGLRPVVCGKDTCTCPCSATPVALPWSRLSPELLGVRRMQPEPPSAGLGADEAAVTACTRWASWGGVGRR
eukprot:scaffold1085_cov407-Prasinococcus_capsulatus_cf.AAC.42